MRWFRRKDEPEGDLGTPAGDGDGDLGHGEPLAETSAVAARAVTGSDAVHAVAARSAAPGDRAAARPKDPVEPTASGPSDSGGHAGALDPERTKQDILDVLRTVYDPEIPVNIYEIGLIYDLDVDPHGRVRIRMTLTSPMCPVAESLPPEVEMKVNAVTGVSEVHVDLVWDPPWNPQMMSEDARLLLGIQ